MKKLLCRYLLFSIISIHAQNGIVFPSLKGVTLDKKNAIIPINNGKYSIIAIAFQQSAQEDLKKWLNPLYNNFMKKDEPGNFDMAELYDVNFIFVPMIAGFKKVADDFKKGTNKEFWPYILDAEKTDVNELQKQLGVEDNKIPYFFVLDKSGKIVDVQSGKYTDDKLEKLEDAID